VPYQQDDPVPPGESTTDLRAWRRAKAREAAPPRRKPLCYGWAYQEVPTAVWRASYSAPRVFLMVRGLPTKGADPLYDLGEKERAVLSWLIWWHERTHPDEATPKELARAAGMHRQSVRRILVRLGVARVIVNIGQGRAQNLAINGKIHEWDLSRLRKLRNAETVEINKRTRRE